MDAITALLGRQSVARLAEPAPQGAQRDQIFRAALRAPDHGRLLPWRFLVVEGEGRERLGNALATAWLRARPDASPEELAKLRAGPLRAPLVLVVTACVVDHPKVPEQEQLLSVACAVQNMLLAAHALGFGGMWRSGAATYIPELRDELGLPADRRVLGFLYVGTPAVAARDIVPPALDAHFTRWGS